jgi:uncharacterized protein (TIGR00290 family)
MNALISWSGGKDSCLALWRAREAGVVVTHALTALEETGARARSHGASRALIEAQTAALGLRSRFLAASWADYESAFIDALTTCAAEGVKHAVFGDIDIAAHRTWEETVCAQSGLTAHLPLWQQDRRALVDAFLGLGFKAWVVCVDGRYLDASYAGREFDRGFLAELPAHVDACGENGEFHTFVYDGPGFHAPVAWRSAGIKSTRASPGTGGHAYHFDLLDVA